MNLFSIKFPHQTINFSKQNRKNPQDIVVNGTIPKPIVPDISVKYKNSVSNYKFGNIYGKIELFLNKNTYSANQPLKTSKAEKMSELDKKILAFHVTGGEIQEFCKQEGIDSSTYRTHLLNLGEAGEKAIEERQKLFDKKREELDKRLLENERKGGNVKAFCDKEGISSATYRNHLKQLGEEGEKATNEGQNLLEQKESKLDKKILENHRTGGSIKNFCDDEKISRTTYDSRISKLGEEGKKAIEERKKLLEESRKKLDERILQNYRTGGNITEFCKENNMKRVTYDLRIRMLGEEGKKAKEERQKILDQRRKTIDTGIIQNHLAQGNITEFCDKSNISNSTYNRHLDEIIREARKSIDILTGKQNNNHNDEKNIQQSAQTVKNQTNNSQSDISNEEKVEVSELDKKILENHRTGGDIGKFCDDEKISRVTYNLRINKLGSEGKKAIEERKQLLEEQRKALDERILQNERVAGSIKDFCVKEKINHMTYSRHLESLGEIGKKATEEGRNLIQQKRQNINKEILDFHATGGDIKAFCKEQGITEISYNSRLDRLGPAAKSAREARQKILEQRKQKLCEDLLEVERSGGDRLAFCKEHNISEVTYYKYLNSMGKAGIEAKEARKDWAKQQKKELDDRILQNHRTGGDIKTFCEKESITPENYDTHLRALGEEGKKAKEERAKILEKQKKELDDRILQNHRTGGDIKTFCDQEGLKIGTYNARIKSLGEEGIKAHKERKAVLKKMKKQSK